MSPTRATAAALLCAAATTAALPARAACPNRASWPTNGWPSIAGQIANQRPAEVAALEEYAFTLTGKDEERLGLRIDALIVIKNGRIVYERYARGWSDINPHIAWSVTKSVTSALAGVAKMKGALTENDPIGRHLPIVNPDARAKDITIRNLMEFSSGFDWKVYEHGVPGVPVARDALRHPRRAGRAVVRHLARCCATRRGRLGLPPVTPPYWPPPSPPPWSPASAGTSPLDLLFNPIGMKSAVTRRIRGHRFGSSYLRHAPGPGEVRLPLPQRRVLGRRALLPTAGWRPTTTVEAPAGKVIPPAEPSGWQWWLNQAVPTRPQRCPGPAVPATPTRGRGLWGRRIIVIPSPDVVIIRTGTTGTIMDVELLASRRWRWQ
jgi:CubicO group peptidase (beta-lactamase class C family)